MFRQILPDDRAVSPVIGVILMVALTVILAAVIGSFVLGLNPGDKEVRPTASFVATYEGNGSATDSATLTIRHTAGEAIPEGSVYVRGENLGGASSDAPGEWAGSASATGSDGPEVVSGDAWQIPDTHGNYTASVVWQSADGENSATLLRTNGPAA